MSDEIKNEIATEQDETVQNTDETLEKEGILSDQEEKKAQKKGKKAKKQLTPEQKKKRTIKALIITGSIVLAIVIFFSGCAIATTVGTNALIKQATSYEKVEYTEHTQLAPVKPEDSDRRVCCIYRF